MGDRDAEVLRDRDGRRDAGHQFKGDAGLLQRERFLAAASKDEAVAAFEPDDTFALLRFLDEESRGLVLRNTVSAAAFPDRDLFGIYERRVVQEFRVQEVVIEDDVRLPQRFEPAQSDESGTGAGPDESHTHSVSSSRISSQMQSKSCPVREVLRSPSRADRR